jgi:group I intron endonuclease
MDNKIGIYRITNPNNEIYIGQSVNIERRFKFYQVLNCKAQTKVYTSLLKYGVESHTFDLIHECPVEELNKWERFYQLFYKNAGYLLLNQRIAVEGNLSGYKSEETKQKMRLAKLGTKQSEEHKRNLALARTGLKRSEETKQKMRKPKRYSEKMAAAVKARIGSGRLLRQWNPSTGELIKIATSYWLQKDGFQICNMCKVALQKGKKHKGFIFEYEDKPFVITLNRNYLQYNKTV